MSDSEKSSLEHEINFSQSSNETQDEGRIGRTLQTLEEEMKELQDNMNDISISSDAAVVASSNRSIGSTPSASLFAPISNELPSRKSSKKMKGSPSRSDSPLIRNRDQNLSTLNPEAVRMSEEGKFEISRGARLEKTKKAREKRKREIKKTQKKIKKQEKAKIKQNKSFSSGMEDLSDLSYDSGLDSDDYYDVDDVINEDDAVAELVDESPELYNRDDFEEYLGSIREYISNLRVIQRLNELVEEPRLSQERRDVIHEILMEDGVDPSYQIRQQDLRGNKKRDRRGGKRKTRKNKNKKKGGGGDWGIFNPPDNWDKNRKEQLKLEKKNRQMRNETNEDLRKRRDKYARERWISNEQYNRMKDANRGNYENRGLDIAKATGEPSTYSPLHSSGGFRRITRKKYNYNKKNRFTRRK